MHRLSRGRKWERKREKPPHSAKIGGRKAIMVWLPLIQMETTLFPSSLLRDARPLLKVGILPAIHALYNKTVTLQVSERGAFPLYRHEIGTELYDYMWMCEWEQKRCRLGPVIRGSRSGFPFLPPDLRGGGGRCLKSMMAGQTKRTSTRIRKMAPNASLFVHPFLISSSIQFTPQR